MLGWNSFALVQFFPDCSTNASCHFGKAYIRSYYMTTLGSLSLMSGALDTASRFDSKENLRQPGESDRAVNLRDHALPHQKGTS